MNVLVRTTLLASLVLATTGACGQTGEAAPGAASGDVPPGLTQGVDPQSVDITALGYDMGMVMAPIRIIEFSDFGCIYCRLFQEESFPALKEEFVDPGHVAWKFIPFDLGSFPNSGRVALAAECAQEQGALLELKGHLFRTQDEWKATPPGEVGSLLDRLAAEAGLDTGRFSRCLDGGLREDRHAASNQAARVVGVRGTPTFIVDGQLVQGAPPLELFQEYLRERVAELGREG